NTFFYDIYANKIMVPRTTQRPTLSQALDKEIYQIVRKLADDQHYASANKLTVSTVYDWIKHSNSSLKRRPKKLLESCIERVLDVLKSEELDDADSLEGDFEGIDDSVPPPVKDHNIMNRSIVRMWANPTSAITPRENSPMESTPTDPVPSMPNSEIMNSPAKADRSATGEPKPKRRKGDRGPVKELDRKPPTGVALEDLGGVDDVILALNEAVAMPM
ncbi:putative AAA domain-containing protein, partial [Lachnellula hyalina]